MATCHDCDQEMITATSCIAYGEVDESVVQGPARCHDCGVKPGGVHHPGCDVERCSVCGNQWISCGHEEHDGSVARWTGVWPGLLEARAAGLFCRDFHANGSPVTAEHPIDWDKEWGTIRFHVPCGPDDSGAHEDLNRLATYQARATQT